MKSKFPRYFIWGLLKDSYVSQTETCIKILNEHDYGIWLGKNPCRSERWKLSNILRDETFKEISAAELVLLD